jgi:hypothetical protein
MISRSQVATPARIVNIKALGVAPSTLRGHLQRVFEKTGTARLNGSSDNSAPWAVAWIASKGPQKKEREQAGRQNNLPDSGTGHYEKERVGGI